MFSNVFRRYRREFILVISLKFLMKVGDNPKANHAFDFIPCSEKYRLFIINIIAFSRSRLL